MDSVCVQHDLTGRVNQYLILAGFAVMIAMGGAGVSYPALSVLSQLVAIAGSCWLLPKLFALKIPTITLVALLGIVPVLLLPFLQMTPVPGYGWTELPGHELAAAIRTQAGLAGSSGALSLRPEATLQGFLALLPPTAAFVSVAFLNERGRIGLLRALVVIAVLNAVLGALQLASRGAGIVAFFGSGHRGDALGVFVNHNHSATFMVAGIVAAATPGVLGGRAKWPAVLGIVTVLALAVLGTTSRTGLLTLGPVLLFCSCLWGRRWALLGLLLLALVAAALSQTHLAQATLARFAFVDQDGRHLFWANTLYAIGLFFPWGSGIGSFTTIYPMVEPLDQLAVPIVNHAHNDYLELALEAGIPGLALLAGGLCLAGIAFVRALSRPAGGAPWQSRSLTLGAGAIVAIVLLHSADDYPLRMTAIAVPFAACLAMLFPRGRRRRSSADRRRPAWWWRGACVAAGLALGWQSVGAGASTYFLLHDQPDRALWWRPDSAEAWSRLAAQRARAADWSGSAQAARESLARAPMDAVAVRVLGLAEAAAKRDAAAEQLMLLGGQLGWRDVPTQLWLIHRALELHDPVVAVQRADALLRQDQQSALLFAQLRPLLADPRSMNALAAELALRPVWRHAFLTSLAEDGAVGGGDVARLYAQLAARGAPADTAESALLLDGLWRAGRYADARTIWNAAGGTGLIADGGFEQAEPDLKGIGPFTWQSARLLGTAAGIALPDDAWRGKALHVEASGIGAGPVARQRLVLAPGAYVLHFLLRDDGPAATRPLWDLACAPRFAASASPPTPIWTAAAHGWLQGEVRFEVAPDCAAQELRLVTMAAHGAHALWVDDVRLSTVAGSGAAGS